MTDAEADSVLDRRMALGIVLERRTSDHPWQDHAWSLVAVIPGGGPETAWRRLEEVPGGCRFYAGAPPLELFPGETEGYVYNLGSAPPKVFVVLRRTGGDGEAPWRPLLVTACPLEAQGYMDHDDDMVEAVAMPPAVEAWVRAFVARHHVDQPFRKRRRSDKEATGADATAVPAAEGRHDDRS